MSATSTGGSSQFAAAVAAIYDTSVAPERWPAALRAVASVFQDIGANLTYRRDDGRFGAIVSPSLESGLQDYLDVWHRQDIRSMRADERGFFACRDVVTDEHLASPEEIETHPFYTEFLARFGLKWSASVNISPDPHTICVLTVQRSAQKAPFTAAEQQLLLRLGRHAENALRLGARLFDSNVGATGLRAALAALPVAVFVLDRTGRVVFANGRANRLLGDSLMVKDGRLTASDLSKRAEFDLYLEAALGRAGDRIADPKPLLLRGVASARPLANFVLPLSGSGRVGTDPLAADAQAIVISVETPAKSLVEPAILRDILGLTLGEARIATLAGSGMPAAEASRRLGISEQAGRALLDRIMAKTGARDSAGLGALLAEVG